MIIKLKDPESRRLIQDQEQNLIWRRWGPYLSYRQWGTVREDYSYDGSCWDYFSHDQSRSRTYRWGEDGIFGITDINCTLCLAPTFWNHRDPIIKERFFGLTGNEGNNGEDVKECYYHIAATPTHSYLKALYKYPQRPFPYVKLLKKNQKLKRGQPEFELIDSGVFDHNEYFDIFIEYAKKTPNDILLRITVINRAPHPAPLFILPTIWFRNTWSWGRIGEDFPPKPQLLLNKQRWIVSHHANFEDLYFVADPANGSSIPLFTENESNMKRLFNLENAYPYVKDSFHRYLIDKEVAAINPLPQGTKACYLTSSMLRSNETKVFQYRLFNQKEAPRVPFGANFSTIFAKRIAEHNLFYENIAGTDKEVSTEETRVVREAYAGLIWTKQFYYYSVREWFDGDPAQPTPDPRRKLNRNKNWEHLYNRDIISMPDKWEYPWYAAWDLAFHAVAFAKIDPAFAKHQLILMLREWYMHPNGQIPAYEFAFSDVNPPVHAWAVWRVYKITAPKGKRDREFLAKAFHKLLLNFTWWVNQKDQNGKNLFSGGFLGLDNIGVFDRSPPYPIGEELEQADATAWMAFYCSQMLAIALELATFDPAYSDIASKFFEHYVSISDAINRSGGTGLWHQLDGFYYDQLHFKDNRVQQLRVRSLIGLIPLLAVGILEDAVVEKLPGFKRRLTWFLEHRKDISERITYRRKGDIGYDGVRLLTIPSREQLERILKYLLSDEEFLSPYGIRSLSKIHQDYPYILTVGDREYRVDYTPGESDTTLFGGNSNWRGPIWFPINYLLIEALERYHYFYEDRIKMEFPLGSGNKLSLLEIAEQLSIRLTSIFLPNESDQLRPWAGGDKRYRDDPNWNQLTQFHEFFHADTGKGLGANHQTGWTALVARCSEIVSEID
jgi:hypothetical protein